MTDTQVCVMGAGIAGALVACLLHDAAFDVVLVDQAPEVVSGASRWNEGKLHLGYTYTATPSLSTADLLLEGAACFEAVIRRASGSPLAAEWYSRPVIYLVSPSSMVPPNVLWKRAKAVASRLRARAQEHPSLSRYVGDGPVLTRLTIDEARTSTHQSDFIAAWRTTERSIAPAPVAELLRRAVGERAVTRVTGRITAVTESPAGWVVHTEDGRRITTFGVANCLWESRAAIDRAVVPSEEPVSIRYKTGLFGSGMAGWDMVEPSTRILGAYGDITPYGNGDVYLSWYPAGLSGLSDTGHPPAVTPPDEDAVRQATLDGLALERLGELPVERFEVRGGFIVARGWGDITAQVSPLHHRSAAGATELAPGYVSVDTGKYSLGPLMATRASSLLREGLARRG